LFNPVVPGGEGRSRRGRRRRRKQKPELFLFLFLSLFLTPRVFFFSTNQTRPFLFFFSLRTQGKKRKKEGVACVSLAADGKKVRINERQNMGRLIMDVIWKWRKKEMESIMLFF
jgi:hypothetical protein